MRMRMRRRRSGSETMPADARLRRTFTLPRNPFSKRSNGDEREQEKIGSEAEPKNPRRAFRRPSWKKFIGKIATKINASAGKRQMKESADASNERVPPWPPDRTPGATGIRNHGNTCFMNAVLQCLSHTDIIAEYFVLDQYKVDLSRRNKLNSKKFGTRGEVTEQLALILKALWACRYYPELSTGFKAVVERHGSQYRGGSQHDAQEFLLWLLDKVHEDLNTATKKKYKTIKNTVGRPDEVVAAETLANHVRCNSSFVQAVFQAQFRSSLACPRCHRQSNTFDPFHCISVQLPNLADRPLLVTVIYVNQQPRCVKLGVRVSAGAVVRELRTILANDTGIPAEDILLAEIDETGFPRTLGDRQPIWSSDSDSDSSTDEATVLYCIEVPRLTPPPPTEPPAPYVLLLWINLLAKDGGEFERFGSPYIMQISRETGYEDLQKLMLKEMASVVAQGVLTARQESGEIRIRLVDPAADEADPNHYLQPELEHPLFTEAAEQALALCEERAGPPHLKLILEWEKTTRDRLLSDHSETCEQHSSVAEVMREGGTTTRLSLSDCLNHYTRAETLAMEDAWRCPECQQYMPVVKTLGLWSLPDILVIHLKRFRQQQAKGRNSTKLTAMVDFPLYNFDMTPHLANKDSLPNNPLLLGGVGWSPWKKPRKISAPNDNSYDLYAVCYHHGDDLETGHYTAACKNPYDQRWYKFDDTRVTLIPNDNLTTELINNGAYILFYQRRHGNFVGCGSNSSSAASTSSLGSNADHWAARMPKFTYQPKKENGVDKKSQKTKRAADSDRIIDDKSPESVEEIEMTNLADTSRLRTSTSSLRDDRSDCKERIEAAIADEKNLRNSISLSDNLRISTGDVGPADAGDVTLEVEPDKLINKDSLYTMGESRRNTLGEYRNANDEFSHSHFNSEIHRNSIGVTVDPCLNHKDIHVNPKMTTSPKTPEKCDKIANATAEATSAFDSKNYQSKQKFERRIPESETNKETVKLAMNPIKTSLFESSVVEPSPTIEWLKDNCMNIQKDESSDEERTIAKNTWISPSSLRRPMVFTSQ